MHSLTIRIEDTLIMEFSLEQTNAIIKAYNDRRRTPKARQDIVDEINNIDLDTLEGAVELHFLLESLGTITLDNTKEEEMKTVNNNTMENVISALYSARDIVVNNVAAVVTGVIAVVSGLFISVHPLYIAGTAVKVGYVFLLTTSNIVLVSTFVLATLATIYFIA